MIEVIDLKTLTPLGKQEILRSMSSWLLNTLCQDQITYEFFEYLLTSKQSNYLFISYDKLNPSIKSFGPKKYTVSTKLGSNMKYTKRKTKTITNNSFNIQRTSSIRGFALVKSKPDYYYIHIICRGVSRRDLRHTSIKDSGSDLLNSVKNHALINNKKEIKLNALPHVILYYKRFGYELNSESQNEHLEKFKSLIKSQYQNNFDDFLHDYNVNYDKTEEIFQVYNLILRGKPNKHAGTATKVENDGILMTLRLK